MTDLDHEDPATVEPAPAPSPSQVPQPGLPEQYDLEGAIAEFEEATKPPAAEAEVDHDTGLSDELTLEQRADRLEQLKDGMEGLREGHARLSEWENHLHQKEEFQDFVGLIATVRQELPEVNMTMTDSMLETWLLGIARFDEKVARDWDRRISHPDQWKNRQNYILGKLLEDVRSLPDREATGDYESVAHAVRGSGSPPPSPAMPNLNKLSDQEFSRFLKDSFGYTSKL